MRIFGLTILPVPLRSPMEQFLDCHGYVALFALSFLASTIIPWVRSGSWWRCS